MDRRRETLAGRPTLRDASATEALAPHAPLGERPAVRPGRGGVPLGLVVSAPDRRAAPHPDDADDRGWLRLPKAIGLAVLLAVPFWALAATLAWRFL